MLDARLSRLAKKEVNADLKYAAKVLGYLGITVTDDALVDLIPFAKSLFCEFMTLVLASSAFGHRREIAIVPPSKGTETQANRPAVARDRLTATVLRLSGGGTVPRDAAIILLRQYLLVHETVPQADLASLFGDVSKQTVSRWCDEWEAHEFITREIIGRTKIVRLPLKGGERAGLRWWAQRALSSHPNVGWR
jgi:hypothetical protein